MLLFFLLSASSFSSNSWRAGAGFHDWNADAESFGDSFPSNEWEDWKS